LKTRVTWRGPTGWPAPVQQVTRQGLVPETDNPARRCRAWWSSSGPSKLREGTGPLDLIWQATKRVGTYEWYSSSPRVILLKDKKTNQLSIHLPTHLSTYLPTYLTRLQNRSTWVSLCNSLFLSPLSFSFFFF
jgi:hypothetical protein